jgi:membrane protease YdiL (CAAX protease family)
VTFVGDGLGAGIFEELGRSGFSTPRLLAWHAYLATALLIGLPWAIWHVLGDYLGGAGYGSSTCPTSSRGSSSSRPVAA